MHWIALYAGFLLFAAVVSGLAAVVNTLFGDDEYE